MGGGILLFFRGLAVFLLGKGNKKGSDFWGLTLLKGRGGDLLSRFRSTIGAARFNFSVRNG